MILPAKLGQKIRQVHEKLDSQGKILSKSQIAKASTAFRERFGPARLNSIDGETLLNTIHNHGNLDSLVYWLEFKNDEEMPGPWFGGLGGGSALKFGIYKRKETGAWMTGSPQKQQELSMDEAVAIARKHRGQFTNGVRVLERLPDDHSDENYLELEKEMEKVAPDVSNTAWGHKYFSLFFPEKLDHYHNPKYQRFHLTKLLQMPPQHEGRYVCAGRYVAISKELDMHVLNLAWVLNDMNERPHRYWRIGTKLGGVSSRWELMQEKGCVAVGWSDIGDLSGIAYNRKDKEKIRTGMSEYYPNPPQIVGRQTQQLFNFVAAIEEGDFVIPSDGEKVLGIGRVVGEYSHAPESDAPHRRQVDWLSFDEWKMAEREGLRTTVAEIKKPINLVKMEKKLFDAPPIDDVPRPKSHVKEQIAALRLHGIPGRIQSILERKGQVILYGPPGTGKTYWAEKTARELASRHTFDKSYEALSGAESLTITGNDSNSLGLVRICTFHPAYGYEDFMEGYRPRTLNDEMVFELRDGILKRLCARAITNPANRYYLIIDEINRGDIPKIFGELLTILEKDKRGSSILLSTSGDSFYIPNNIHIIGTMNTADRSIALLDTALRRRFGFIELMPDISVLGNAVIEGIPLGPWLSALNAKICEHIGRDARNLQIGHSYLLDAGKPIASYTRLVRVLQDDIFPLIEEYCYEDYGTLKKILGKSLVDEENQRLHSDLLKQARKDDLIQALKSIDPDLDSSAPALLSEAEASVEDEESSSEELDSEGET